MCDLLWSDPEEMQVEIKERTLEREIFHSTNPLLYFSSLFLISFIFLSQYVHQSLYLVCVCVGMGDESKRGWVLIWGRCS